jgi:hypothetical protein
MRTFLALFALLLFASLGFSQPGQVQVNADCVVQFNLNTSGQTLPASGGFNNTNVGCISWQLVYANNGFSGITLTLQSAPNTSGNPAICTPGSWGTMGGTIVFGVNPNTNTSAASTLIQASATNFAACYRVVLTSATGSGNVTGVLLGYRAVGTAGTGGSTSNVTITGPLGQAAMASSVSVVLPNNQVSGCTRGFTNLSTNGNVQLIAGVGGQHIYLCDFLFSTGTPEDFKLTSGTCAGAPTDTTALFKNVSAVIMGNDFAAERITINTGDSVCGNQANNQAAGLTYWFIQQ